MIEWLWIRIIGNWPIIVSIVIILYIRRAIPCGFGFVRRDIEDIQLFIGRFLDRLRGIK